MPSRRSAVLLVRDERSRAVCSLLLRHQGFRVLEASDTNSAITQAVDGEADLILADLGVEERASLHRELMNKLPDATCLFVNERQPVDVLERRIHSTTKTPADNASRN